MTYGIKECVKIVFTNQDANETLGALWNYHQREQGIIKASVCYFIRRKFARPVTHPGVELR